MKNADLPAAFICATCLLLCCGSAFGGERFKDIGDISVISEAQSSGFSGGEMRDALQDTDDQAACVADVSFKIVYFLLKKEDYSRAEVCLTRKINQDPANAATRQAYRLRAVARMNMEDYAGVVEDAGAALQINSRDVAMLNELALALIRLGKARQALTVSREAMELDPENAETYGIRSEAWRTLGRPREELIDLANAAQHDPGGFQSAYQEALDQYGRQ